MELVAATCLAALVSVLVCASLIGAGPIDVPNLRRKGHASPTPTSGGIGIASGFAAALIALALAADVWNDSLNAEAAHLLTSVAFFSYAFLIVGFYDDAHPLGPRLKLFFQAVFSMRRAGRFTRFFHRAAGGGSPRGISRTSPVAPA